MSIRLLSLSLATGVLLVAMNASAASIVTLATVQVRPSVEQIAGDQAVKTDAIRLVSLPTVEVRPSAMQRLEQRQRGESDLRAAKRAALEASQGVAALAERTVIELATPQLPIVPTELKALIAPLVHD